MDPLLDPRKPMPAQGGELGPHQVGGDDACNNASSASTLSSQNMHSDNLQSMISCPDSQNAGDPSKVRSCCSDKLKLAMT